MRRSSGCWDGHALPEYLADRDLGKTVVNTLRAAGIAIHTLAEMFDGEQGAQHASDVVEWIAVAGRHRWAALTRNKRIRYVTEEREAVAQHRVPVFALVNGNLNIVAMAAALLAAMPRLDEICATDPGGSIWIVERSGAVRLWWPRPGDDGDD